MSGAVRLGAWLATVLLLGVPSALLAQSPPYKQCPPVGASNSCQILLVINADGSVTVLNDPRVLPFDYSPQTYPLEQADDALVGVQNNSRQTVTALSLRGDGIFAFDIGPEGSDPSICALGTPGCATGYEGPGVSFEITDYFYFSTGVVHFDPGIPPGGSAYFGLENPPGSVGSIVVPPTTTCPAPTATVGSAYSSQLTGTGGSGSYTWAVTAGTLAPLTLSTSGLVSGTPTATGMLRFTLTITDSTGSNGTQACTITVNPPELAITALSPSTVKANSGQFNLQVTGRGFLSGAAVRWTAGSEQTTTLSTTVNSPTQLTAVVPANLIATTGTVQISVVIGTGAPSNSLPLTITPNTPTLTSVSPSKVNLNAAEFTVDLTGTNFDPGAVVRWTAPNNGVINLPTEFISATELQATVAGNLLTLNGTAQLAVINPGNLVSNPVPLMIGSLIPTLTSLSPSATEAGSGSVTLTAIGSDFAPEAGLQWTGPGGATSTLPTDFVTAAQLQATLPASLLTTPGTAQVAIVNPGNQASNTQQFTITPPVPQSLSVSVGTVNSPTDQATITLNTSAPTPVAYTGTLTLSFTPDNVAGWLADFVDPALKFPNNSLTTTVDIPANSTSVPLSNAAIQQGTVAGTITVTLSGLRLASTGQDVPLPSPATATLQVKRLAPVILPGTVRLAESSGGVTIDLQGYSTVRDLSSATFTFSPAANSDLQGTTTFTITFSANDAAKWFDSDAGRSAGSLFHLQIPFTVTGSTSAIGSVSVTLQNSVGTSAAVSGSR